MENVKISKYVSLYEAICYYSALRSGIDNLPVGDHYENMVATAKDIFDPCREAMGGPLFCHCIYRGSRFNAITPGSDPNSDHTRGQAVDMDCDQYGFGDNRKLFMFVAENLDWDNLIWEYGSDEKPNWVHVSYKRGNNRKIITRKELNKPYVRHYDTSMPLVDRFKFLGIPA